MFFQNMATAAEQVFILYIIVAVGFIADRLQIFSEKTARAITGVLFYVITPCVIVRSFLSMEFTKDSASGLGLSLLCNIGTFAMAILLSTPFFRKANKTDPVYKFAAAYGNMGYMGLPLGEAVLGAEGAFYCSAGVIAFNMFSFTHGVWTMTRHDKGSGGFQLRRLFLNPGVISVCIGLPLFLLSVSLPKIIMQPIEYLANMNSPIAMLILGAYISNTDLRGIFKQKELYLVILVKIIILPLVMLGIFKLVGLEGVLLTALIISASTPSANNTVMFAAKYDKDTSTASKTVAFVSFASILTMPIMIALSQL